MNFSILFFFIWNKISKNILVKVYLKKNLMSPPKKKRKREKKTPLLLIL